MGWKEEACIDGQRWIGRDRQTKTDREGLQGSPCCPPPPPP